MPKNLLKLSNEVDLLRYLTTLPFDKVTHDKLLIKLFNVPWRTMLYNLYVLHKHIWILLWEP